MARHYSTKDFFRQIPNGLLARYFHAQGLLGDLSREGSGPATRHLRRFTVRHVYHQRNLKGSFHVTHSMTSERCLSPRGHKS